jgi:hypothetical protein
MHEFRPSLRTVPGPVLYPEQVLTAEEPLLPKAIDTLPLRAVPGPVLYPEHVIMHRSSQKSQHFPFKNCTWTDALPGVDADAPLLSKAPDAVPLRAVPGSVLYPEQVLMCRFSPNDAFPLRTLPESMLYPEQVLICTWASAVPGAGADLYRTSAVPGAGADLYLDQCCTRSRC